MYTTYPVTDSLTGLIEEPTGGGGGATESVASPYIEYVTPVEETDVTIPSGEFTPQTTRPSDKPACSTCGAPAPAPAPAPGPPTPAPLSTAPGVGAAAPSVTPSAPAALRGLPWWVWPLGLVALSSAVRS